ncbi:hypothetical protein BASA84_000111 [Batrachochytrium salamandrivorans]|nr:hypothetical protein BASA84_000111 [Batrachochytrium salamandrivorans]
MDHWQPTPQVHSLDLQYWHDRQPIQALSNTPTIRNSDILDQDFSWNQIAAALLQMSPRKAPGDDGISTAFYQAALYMPANTQEGVPPTPFARALLRMATLSTQATSEALPSSMSALKLVCKVLQMRIERFVETNNLLSYEQAGFRKREECVGQVVSLVDIIQRRQNAGLNTHVLFIDIRKAFDTVPVGALLWKLQNMGFPRRTLAFLKALVHILICSSTGRITSIGPIPVQRGVRQGCPLSGLLFNLFINDILDGVAPITVPGLPRDTTPSEDSSPRLDNPLDIRLHGQLVSRVESYKYLGVLIDSKLDHSAWLKQKRTTINKGIRLFTGARLSTAIGPLLVETGIGSLLTRSLVSRVRLLERSVTKRTPINAICSGTDNDVFTLNVQGQLVRSQRWFWSRRTKQLYRNRYWLTPQIRPKTVKQRHSFALMETLRTCGDSASLQNKLLSTSIAHLVVECEQVTGHRIQSGLVPAIQKSRLRLLGRALDPGVENVYTWLRGGVLMAKQIWTSVGWTGLWSMNLWGRGMIIGRWQHGSVRMRSTDSDRSVRATPKKARDASPPPQDDLQTTTTATTTTATIATTTDQPSKDTRFADAVKRRPTHQQLVERQPEFRKAGAAAWLALKRETSVPAHSAPKVELSSGLRLIYASGFPTLSLATFERQCRVPASVPVHPKESLPVKKATDKEPAAPAVDPPSDMAAEVTPATQDDGVTPTVTPIADNHQHLPHSRYTALQPSRYHYLRSILAPILGHQMEHVSKIDRRTTKHGARFRITVPEDRQRNIIQRLERQSKQTHWRIRQNYRHRRPDQPRPTAPPPPLSRQILAVNVANISNKRPAIRHIVRNTRLWAISETCITSSKFRFTVPGFDVIQHPATGPGRRGIALGIPSCFGGHEHGSAVGTMILAKVPNFTPECLWIVGSVYVGHSGATTNYSRREAFASIRQSLDRVVPFDNNHPVLIFGDWNTDPQRLQRIVHSWGHGLTVMQFSGSQITRLSTVHGRRHSSIDHFVCNAPARALLTSPRVDRQTAVADHFVIRTSIRAEAQGQPPAPRAPTISRHHFFDSHHQPLDPIAGFLSGTTKRAILASNTARQAFIAAATHTNPDPVQCNTLRDEWSRLKAAATQLERVDGRKQWVKHADNLDRAVSDGRTDLVFSAARAMSGNSSRSAAVTPLYNSDGIVQYDPTSDPACHARNSDILDQDFSWNQIAAALLQMSPRKAPGDDGITTAFYQAALYMPANTQEGVPPTPFARALLRVCGQVFASATIPRAWLCASIVSIDKKDGDPLNPGDKRGIALINVG